MIVRRESLSSLACVPRLIIELYIYGSNSKSRIYARVHTGHDSNVRNKVTRENSLRRQRKFVVARENGEKLVIAGA